MDDPRGRRRLLRPGDRQPRPAAGDRRALPRRARLPGRARLRPHPAGRGGVAAGRQPLLRPPGAARSRAAPAGPTSAPCPTASTPSRSSPTSSSSCCRPSSPPRLRARPIRRRSPGRPGSSPASARGSSSSPVRSSPSGSAESTPRAALLSTLAGIALTFIALGFLFRTFARPIVGLTTLGVVMLVYFGRVRFRGGLPGGLVAVGLGTALAWFTGLAPVGAAAAGLGRFPSAGPGLRRALRGPARELAGLPLGHPADGPLQRHRFAAEHRVGRGRRRLATRPGPRSPSTASGRSPRRSSARAFRPRSTSATRAGRRWARAPATRS